MQHQNRNVDGKLSISQVRMWNFMRIERKTKKVTAFHKSSTMAVAWNHLLLLQMWTTTFLRRNSTSGTSLESFRSRKLKYSFSSGSAKRRKNYSSFQFLPENLEKFRLTELYDVPVEGPTIFLYCRSLGHTSMESCRLAELKYAIFSGTGRKTKKLRCSKLFLLTVSKHGLLEGSPIGRTSMESCQLAE